MTLSNLDILLRHPQSISGTDSSQLKAIRDQYPYFQSARSLYLKSLYATKSDDYNQELKITAAHTLDRDILFNFIVSSDFIAIDPLQSNENSTPAIKMEEITIASPVEELPTVDEGVLNAHDTDELPRDNTETTSSETSSDEELRQEPQEPKLTSTAIKSLLQSITIHENQEVVKQNTDKQGITKNKDLISELKETKTDRASLPNQDQENSQVETPVSFNDKERLSFSEWLQLSLIKPINRENDPVLTDPQQKSDIEKQKKSELIDKFIETNPKIIPTKKPTVIPVNIDTSVQENSSLMTETLAKIYLEQKKYQKAIQAYEILILKYPEKSSFFADQILDIKALQQHNS